MPYKLIYIGLGLIAVAAIALGLVLSTEGDPLVLPEPLESVYPEPNALVPTQSAIEVDLHNGYEAEIYIDGWPISNPRFIQATGVYRWSPGPSDPLLQEWTPGEHTVRVTWDTYSGYPDPGAFEWSFRVG